MDLLSKRMQVSFVPQNFTIFSEDSENLTILRPHPCLTTSSEPSNLIKLPEKEASSISSKKPLASFSMNSREYCLVHLENKKYCVLSIRMIKNQKNSSISIDKTYNIMFGNKIKRGTVVLIGHKFDCFNRMKRLQANAIKDENLEKPACQGIEEELKKKDQIIKSKDDEINKLNKSIENFKRIIDKENVKSMKKFCSNILELCENEPVCSDLIQSKTEKSVCVSENYPDERFSVQLKCTMEEALKKSDTSSLAFRKVMTLVFPDVFLWAENCRKTMVDKFPERIMACFDFVKTKYPEFTLNTAWSIMTKISSNSRVKLKHLGYSIVSKYDTANQTSTHEIFKANNSKANAQFGSKIEKKACSTNINVENKQDDVKNAN